VVECLPSIHKALVSIPSTGKNYKTHISQIYIYFTAQELKYFSGIKNEKVRHDETHL
jgi:hypothetical protein